MGKGTENGAGTNSKRLKILRPRLAKGDMGEWRLSRRDRLIIATHKLQGTKCLLSDAEAPVLEGRLSC
jgi:hypothetical protein